MINTSLIKLFQIIKDMGFLVVRLPPAAQASALLENFNYWAAQNSETSHR